MLSPEMNRAISQYANSHKNPISQITERMSDKNYAAMIRSNSNPDLSSQEGVKYFEGIDFKNPLSYEKAIAETRDWWKTHKTPYSNLPMADAIEQQIIINQTPFAAAPSPYVYMPDMENLYKHRMFSRLPKTLGERDFQYNILKGHETAHIITTPRTNSPLSIELSPDDYFVRNNSTEVSARGTQLKNYFNSKTLSEDELKYAAEHYTKDTGVDNDMTAMFNIIKKIAKKIPQFGKRQLNG